MPTHQLNQPEIGNIDASRTERVNSGSKLSDAKFLMYKSQDTMDAALIAAGYTAARVAVMTTNDKQYAISLINA